MLRTFFLLLLLAMNSFSAEIPFYLGTYTSGGKSKGIYRGTLDAETGALGPLVLAGAADDPSFIALSPDGKFLYAAIEKGPGSVAAFSVGGDGLLAPLGAQPSGGAGTCHVSVAPDGKRVYAANYNAGNVASFPVAPDGSLGARDAFVQFTGTGPDPKRQEAPHAHSIYPVGASVYACDLGTDSVHVFGTLLDGDKPAKTPPASGPRHLAFPADGRFVYAINEMALSATAFSREASTGLLTPLDTVSLLADGAVATGSTSGEIAVHPSGKWVYASVRGLNTLVVLAVGADGKLTVTQTVPARVKTPRSFAIDPSGRWLVAAGQDDDTLAVFRIDAATGALAPVGKTVAAPRPVCVLFAPAN